MNASKCEGLTNAESRPYLPLDICNKFWRRDELGLGNPEKNCITLGVETGYETFFDDLGQFSHA